MKLLALLAFAAGLWGQDCIKRPCMGATNFSADLTGPLDTREGTWGRADFATMRITFRPPPGYRVRILRASGDLVSWIRGVVPPGANAGVLAGLSTTAPEGSMRADLLADSCFLYVQSLAGQTRSFSEPTAAGGLLESDNVAVLKLAAWLNDSGLPVHLEVTMNLMYRFVRE